MKTLMALGAVAALMIAPPVNADNGNHNGNGSNKPRAYEVTVTNITHDQSFTPVFAATHTSDIAFFVLGAPPSQALADLAEGGAFGGLQSALQGLPQFALDTADTGMGLIGPGQSKSVMIYGSRDFDRLSLAAMLLPTNDSFVAVDSMPLPRQYATVLAPAYDAGSEDNDELCANIPGPHCGGAPFSAGLGEGFVHISRGISGVGDLGAADYDWRNPVAQVTVRRID